jgi:hypothetical protein
VVVLRFNYERDLDFCAVTRCKRASVIIFSGGSVPFITDAVGLCDEHHEKVMGVWKCQVSQAMSDASKKGNTGDREALI